MQKGTLVKLNAVLTYTENEKEQAVYQCVVCVYPKKLSGEEKIKKIVTENMKRQMKSSGNRNADPAGTSGEK